MSVLSKVAVSWASVQEPNTQFEPAWEILCHLSKEQADALIKEAKAVHPKGIKIKKEEDGSLSIRFKRSVERKDGKGENKKPVVVDKKAKPFEDLIGNGSICNIEYSLVPWNNKFGSGITTDLKAVQVLELVPYGAKDGASFAPVEDDADLDAEEKTAFDDADFE